MTDPTANVAATSSKLADAPHGICVGCKHPIAWHRCMGAAEVGITGAGDRPCTCIDPKVAGPSLVVTSCETLAEGLRIWGGADTDGGVSSVDVADDLIDNGVVRVVDPGDPERRERVALAITDALREAGDYRDAADAAIKAVLEP